MNKSITQPITQACLFSSHAYFQVSQFLEALIFEPRLFSSTRLFSRKYGTSHISFNDFFPKNFSDFRIFIKSLYSFCFLVYSAHEVGLCWNSFYWKNKRKPFLQETSMEIIFRRIWSLIVKESCRNLSIYPHNSYRN